MEALRKSTRPSTDLENSSAWWHIPMKEEIVDVLVDSAEGRLIKSLPLAFSECVEIRFNCLGIVRHRSG